MYKQARDEKSIVIVGGGHAGIALANSLSAKLDPSTHSLTLVTTRPFFAFLPPMVRLAVTGDEEMADKVLMPYDHLFVNGNGKIVMGTVIRVDDHATGGCVVLDSGDTVNYDILVLATGSKWNAVQAPDTREDVSTWLKAASAGIRNAKSIVLVGGGAVGAEFAGEIKDIAPVSFVLCSNHRQLMYRSLLGERSHHRSRRQATIEQNLSR
jgi:apoptosis-inducing factor 2